MDTTAVCSKRKGAGGETDVAVDVAVGVVRVVGGGDENGVGILRPFAKLIEAVLVQTQRCTKSSSKNLVSFSGVRTRKASGRMSVIPC